MIIDKKLKELKIKRSDLEEQVRKAQEQIQALNNQIQLLQVEYLKVQGQVELLEEENASKNK